MLNVVTLMGRLVADPELRHTPNDIAATSFTIAVDRSYVKSGEERQADFIDIAAWRGTAEFVCKYFRKGQLIAVEGSIQTRTYTDRNQNKRKAVEVVANNAHFAGSRDDGNTENQKTAGQGGSNKTSKRHEPPLPDDADPFEEDKPGNVFNADDDLPF